MTREVPSESLQRRHAAMESARCARCSFLDEPTQVAAHPACRLRRHAIEQPDGTFCVNHPGVTPRRLRVPVGPVFVAGAVREVAYASPDSPRIRGELIELIAEFEPRGVEDLELCEATAMWQLEQFGERRARAHLDRIQNQLARGISGRQVFHGWLLGPSVAAALGEQDAVDSQPGLFDRLTVVGKLLVLLSLVAAVWSLVEVADLMATGQRNLLSLGRAGAGSAAVAGIGFVLARQFGVEILKDSPAAQRVPEPGSDEPS